MYKKILYALLAIVIVICIGTVGYKLMAGETATWLDCLYMTVITVTTVGYAEVIDVTHIHGGRAFTMFILAAGMCALWFCFSAFTAMLLANDLNLSWRRRRMEQQIKKMQGHYIICGYGRVGRNVGSELDTTNHAYVAIDQDSLMLEQHRELKQNNLRYLAGDASDDELLERANVKEAVGVFAVTGDDSLNLMIVMSTKHLNPQARIVARCHEVRNFEKITRAGADHVISPDFSGGMSIASAMVRPTVVNFLDEMMRGRNNLRVEEVTVPHQFRPTMLGNINLNRNADYVLLAVRTEMDWTFNPNSDHMLCPGQGLIVMASPSGRNALAQLLATIS